MKGAENILNKDFTAEKPNEKWLTDDEWLISTSQAVSTVIPFIVVGGVVALVVLICQSAEAIDTVMLGVYERQFVDYGDALRLSLTGFA